MREKLKSGFLFFNIILLASLFLISLTISLEPAATSGPLYAITRWIRGDSEPKKTIDARATTSAFPNKLAVVQPGGVFGTYTSDRIEPLYEKMSPMINEAIGSAEAAREITMDQYTSETMHTKCIYLEYDGRIPLYAIRIWSGASGVGFDYNVRTLNFCDDGNKIRIVFYDYITNKFYACDTSADRKMFEDIIAAIAPNSAFFARADEWYAPLYGDELVFADNYMLPIYAVTLPKFVAEGALSRGILDSFAMSEYLTETFVDTDQARVYVQGSSVLRLEANGRLVYSAPEADAARAVAGDEHQIKVALADQVRKMAESVLEDTEGTGLYLKEITAEVNGEYEIIFGRECGGVPIGDYSAKPIYAKISNGAIVFFEMQIYNLTQTGETAVLPYRQAMAVIPKSGGSLRMSVRYSSADGQMTPYLGTQAEERSKKLHVLQ